MKHCGISGLMDTKFKTTHEEFQSSKNLKLRNSQSGEEQRRSNRVNHNPEPLTTKDLLRERVKPKINIYTQKKGDKNIEGCKENKMLGKREKKRIKRKGAKKAEIKLK